MPKMSTELVRHALSGPTMGTRWSAVFHAPGDCDAGAIARALAAEVCRVDDQMSTWRPETDLMRLNAAPSDVWVPVPEDLLRVLTTALAIGRRSGGAFDIAVGDAVGAWGFRGTAPEAGRIRAAMAADRRPAHEILELDAGLSRVRRHGPAMLDLCGIAKGYGADLMAAALRRRGITDALLGLDGELVAAGAQPGGRPWTIAIERPDPGQRAPLAVLALSGAAVATSGDYRHWIEVGAERLSHTIDPRRGAPLRRPPASVTVVAQSCIEADAWATALTVLGPQRGAGMARRLGLHALFLERGPEGLVRTPVGPLFAEEPALCGAA